VTLKTAYLGNIRCEGLSYAVSLPKKYSLWIASSWLAQRTVGYAHLEEEVEVVENDVVREIMAYEAIVDARLKWRSTDKDSEPGTGAI
jgi:hypothetical protein